MKESSIIVINKNTVLLLQNQVGLNTIEVKTWLKLYGGWL